MTVSAGGLALPDPAGLAAVNPTNPQTWSMYAYVANQPLESTDPLGLFEAPFDVFGDPCGGGPGPCDPNDIGWNPWPGPGCGGGGGWGYLVYPILPSGGGGSVLGGADAAPAGPCTAGICSPSSLIAPGGGTDAGVLDGAAAVFSVTVEACALNPECIAAVIALGPEAAAPVLGAALIYEGVKLGIGIYQAQHGRGNVADTGVLAEAQSRFPNLPLCGPGGSLQIPLGEAKAAANTEQAKKIKATIKGKCRGWRG